MKNHLFSLLKFLIGWPFALVAFFFIMKLLATHSTQLLNQITEINYVLLSIGFGCFLLFYGIRSYIWYILLKHQNGNISFKNACYFWAISELKRYIPGNIWSLIGRTVLFSDIGITKKDLAKNLVIEAELLIIGAVLTSLLSIPFLLRYQLMPPEYVVPLFSIVTGIVFLYIFSNRLKRETKRRVVHLIHFVIPEISPGKQLVLATLSTVAFFFFGFGHYFIFISFISINPQLVWQITGVSTLAFLIGYFSLLTPSGFGVREGALIFFLNKVMSVTTAAFAAIFSRLILVVSELFFIGLTYLWHKTKNTKLIQTEHWIKTHKQVSILICLFLLFCAYFIPATFLRYDNFYTGKYDLGNMSQTVWNTTQGRFFQLTNPDNATNMSRLGVHADFILLLFAPLYLIWPDPRILLFFQTIIVGAGAFFVYLIGKKILQNRTLAVVFSFAYLINPSVQRATLYDFHAVTLATTFLLGTFYFFLTKRYKLFLLFAILSGLCKEQIWIIIGIFGLFLFFQHKKRLFGSLLFLGSFALSYFLISFAIPHTLGSEHFALSFYAEFGGTPSEVIKTLIFSPDRIISTLLDVTRIFFLNQLLSPVGYLSLLAPVYLVFIIPDLLLKLVSSNSNYYRIYYQYTAELSTFIFISAIYGISSLRRIIQWTIMKAVGTWHLALGLKLTANRQPLTAIFILYLFTTSLYTAYLYGPLPGAKEPNTAMITQPIENKTFIEEALLKIPPHAKVAASNTIASHLSNREYIAVLPLGLETAEYVVFLLTDTQSPEKFPLEFRLIQQLKNDPRYILLSEKDSFVMFKKNAMIEKNYDFRY